MKARRKDDKNKVAVRPVYLRKIMKIKLRPILSVAYVIVLVVAVCYALWTRRENDGLQGMISFYQSQLVLTTNDCKLISADLASKNPARLAIEKAYFDRAAEGKIVSGRADLTFREALAVYKDQYVAAEKPARSYYFGNLLGALAEKPDSETISEKELLGYLGKPDETTNSPGGQVMVYKFRAEAGDAVALIETKNGTVSTIDIQLAHAIGKTN